MGRNFADLILRHATESPERVAIRRPTEWLNGRVQNKEEITFGELSRAVARVRSGLASEGLQPGDRVILMFPVSLRLYELVLGMLSSGLAVVLIDTGMGKEKILQAIEDSRARAIFSVDALLKYHWILPKLWGLKKYSVDGSGLVVRSVDRLLLAAANEESEGPSVARDPDDHALITFTSGSTGRPKGADRTHGLLTAQHEALAEHFPHESTEVDMPCFPVVTLHNLCCGITTVLPPVDFAAVSQVDAEAVWSWASDQGVTRMSGAPAYIEPLVAALESGTAPPDSLRALGVGGARVPRSLAGRALAVLPGRECKVLYGSTEAEPIASAPFEDVVAAEAPGVLVGHEAHAAEVALVDLPEPPPVLDERGLAPYLVPHGELVVRGPHVNRGYLDNPAADRACKLPMPDGTVWHRTGDVAQRDAQGRLWLTARTKDLVVYGERTLHPFAIEEALEALPELGRVALVDAAGPSLVFETAATSTAEAAEAAVREQLAVLELSGLPLVGLPHGDLKAIPTDRRHNSKIDRPALRAALQEPR